MDMPKNFDELKNEVAKLRRHLEHLSGKHSQLSNNHESLGEAIYNCRQNDRENFQNLRFELNELKNSRAMGSEVGNILEWVQTLELKLNEVWDWGTQKNEQEKILRDEFLEMAKRSSQWNQHFSTKLMEVMGEQKQMRDRLKNISETIHQWDECDGGRGGSTPPKYTHAKMRELHMLGRRGRG